MPRGRGLIFREEEMEPPPLCCKNNWDAVAFARKLGYNNYSIMKGENNAEHQADF